MVVVQEKEDEADFPDLPSHGYVPLRRAPTEKEENPGSQVPNEEELITIVPAKEYSHEQENKLWCLKYKKRRLRHNW